MKKTCSYCGKELDVLLPFNCKRCGNYFCNKHRLPEHHSCSGVKAGWDTWKKEQRKLQELPEEKSFSYKPVITRSPDSKKIKKTKENERTRRYHAYESKGKRSKGGHRRKYSLLQTIIYKLRRTRFPSWFIVILILMLVVAIVHQYYEVKILTIDISVVFYLLELITVSYLMFSLIKRLDRIHVGSDLRLFGLRILSGIIGGIGAYLSIIFLIFGMPILITGMMGDFGMVKSMYSYLGLGFLVDIFSFGSEFSLPFTGVVLYLTVTVSLTLIGGFLFFKFQRGTGPFVWFGRA